MAYRGELDKAIEYAHEILRLGEAQDDAGIRATGYAGLGGSTGFAGDLPTGLGYLEQAIATFQSGGYQSRQLRLGLDPRVSCLTTSGFFLWLLGRPDRAVEQANRAVALATDLDHPYSLAYAYYHAGFLHLWRQEPEVVQTLADRARDVAERNDLTLWRALSTCLQGAATSRLGRPEEGLRQMAAGIDQYQALRTPPVFWPMLRFMQAQALVEAATPSPGFPLIDEALEVGGADGIFGPLFHIVRGDLSLLGKEASATAAADSYRRAHEASARLGERMTQLRAAVRLVRLAPDPDRARWADELRKVHATFSEGFGTPDLVEASELLAP